MTWFNILMMSTETEDYSVFAVQHCFGALLGIVLLVYLVWHHGKSSHSVGLSHKVNDGKDVGENDFTRCQSSSCVTCHKDDHAVWKKRLQTYIKTHASESHKLSKLTESLKSETCDGQDCHSKLQKPTVCSLPTVKTCPWYELKQFSGTVLHRDVHLLTDNFATIKKDCTDVHSAFLNGDKSGWTENVIQSGSWMVFHFFNQGQKMEDNCNRCPSTAGVLEALETLMSGISFGHACFSILRPGSHITPHYGPCNLRVRCHLGLQIPKETFLTVAGETKAWKEGGCLLFDDSFLHEARNTSAEEQTRAILMVDLWHPDLTEPEKEALKYTFSPGCLK